MSYGRNIELQSEARVFFFLDGLVCSKLRFNFDNQFRVDIV